MRSQKGIKTNGGRDAVLGGKFSARSHPLDRAENILHLRLRPGGPGLHMCCATLNSPELWPRGYFGELPYCRCDAVGKSRQQRSSFGKSAEPLKLLAC